MPSGQTFPVAPDVRSACGDKTFISMKTDVLEVTVKEKRKKNMKKNTAACIH